MVEFYLGSEPSRPESCENQDVRFFDQIVESINEIIKEFEDWKQKQANQDTHISKTHSWIDSDRLTRLKVKAQAYRNASETFLSRRPPHQVMFQAIRGAQFTLSNCIRFRLSYEPNFNWGKYRTYLIGGRP